MFRATLADMDEGYKRKLEDILVREAAKDQKVKIATGAILGMMEDKNAIKDFLSE